MAYNYYRQNGQGGWGTNQYQFGPPPTPGFQPQPSWGGLDFYRAHALSPDESLYRHAYETVRAPIPGLGVGLHEARHWHRRAYGGLVDPLSLTPDELGYASAYEAYRVWIHNADIVQPISGDPERQREAMIGLAVAEAARALQYSGRVWDTYSRNRAADAAAATAAIIYDQVADDMEDEYEYGGRRARSRRGSVASIGSSYADDYDPYQQDFRARPRRRHRSVSGVRRSYSQGPPLTPPIPYAGSPMPGGIPPMAGSASSTGSYSPSPYQGQQYGTPYAGSAYGSTPGMGTVGGMGGGMGGMGGMSGNMGGVPGSMGGGGVPMSMPSAAGSGYQVQTMPPQANGMPAPIVIKPQSTGYERRRAQSMSVPYPGQYPGAQYGSQYGSQYGGMGMQPGMGGMQPGMMGQPGMGMGMGMGMNQGYGLGTGLGSGGMQYGAQPGYQTGTMPGQPIIVQVPRRHKHRHKHHHRSSSRHGRSRSRH
ncbi:uncharacterized protein SCHCODRAFT_02635496 [Schizophyllum commune H4-8]|nr:uncharacterized protein SCHCODRAFT_02635496 [Schizophyllum commune H4-8]KAI5889747.1 hypothetical protein SCHCODRAFT_02635496 [Schizophyllum commune H4-8]